SVDVVVGITGLGTEHVTADGQPVTARSTLPVNPFRAVTTTLDVALPPGTSVSEDAFAKIEKSGLARFRYASTSTMRLQIPSAVAVTNTRIFDVATGANVNLRHTRLLSVTVPPGIAVHALPVQYCTSKLRSPYSVNVIVDVGVLGD